MKEPSPGLQRITPQGDEEAMGEGQDADVGQIIDQIRENIRRRRAAGQRPVPENRSSAFDDGHAAADFARLHSDYDIRNASFVSNVSNRRVVGRVVVARKMLSVGSSARLLERQVAYNAARSRVTTHLKEWVGTLDREPAQAIQVVNGKMDADTSYKDAPRSSRLTRTRCNSSSRRQDFTTLNDSSRFSSGSRTML